MALTSALFISVGSVLSVPIAIIVDRLVRQSTLAWGEVGGIILIFCGFAFVTYGAKLEAAASRWCAAKRRGRAEAVVANNGGGPVLAAPADQQTSSARARSGTPLRAI